MMAMSLEEKMKLEIMFGDFGSKMKSFWERFDKIVKSEQFLLG